jgi:hypothetical protein
LSSSFAVGFDPRDAERVTEMWRQVFASQRWIEGPFTERFETLWGQWNGLSSVAMGTWSGAALAALEYFKVKGKRVLCPSNTFMAISSGSISCPKVADTCPLRWKQTAPSSTSRPAIGTSPVVSVSNAMKINSLRPRLSSLCIQRSDHTHDQL